MSGNGYTTTMSAAGVAETIGAARRVVVTTHAKPDGDAVGSVLACVRLVQRLGGGREAEGWFAGPFPSWLGTVAGATPIRKLGESTASVGRPWDDADLVLVVDTGSWSQVEPVKAWLSARVDRTLIIDHHLHGSPDLAENISSISTRIRRSCATSLPCPPTTPSAAAGALAWSLN